MSSKRLLLMIPFFLLATLAFWAYEGEAQPGTVKNISPGVWFREGEQAAMGHCNNIFIEMKDYLIVVDANFPSGARLALEDIKKLSKKPVQYVFDTHHHGDHAYGNPVWTQAGATTLAYVGVAEEMKEIRAGSLATSRPAAQRRRRSETQVRRTSPEDLYRKPLCPRG